MNELHQRIQEATDDLAQLLIRKNIDYGNSFQKSYEEYGDIMLAIRLEDKLNRLKTLIKNKEQQVNDESLEDTVLDIAGYAILRLVMTRE